MRVMMFVIHRSGFTAPDAWKPTPEAIASMSKFNDEMKAAGVLVDLNGCFAPSQAVRVTHEGGKTSAKAGHEEADGEVVGGYWTLNVNSLDEAAEWAKKAPMAHDCVIEIRQVYEMPPSA